MIHIKFIRSVLGEFEGRALCRGYVPCERNGEPMQNSGITIGTGVDLGQQSKEKLEFMRVPAAIIRKLEPYLGLRRYEAINQLTALPLNLDAGEVAALDDGVMSYYIHRAAAAFDDYARLMGQTFFGDRPQEVQAVYCSLHYQFGSPARFPATSKHLVIGDYRAAIAELCNPAAWGGRYTPRRRAEANILRGLYE